MGKKKQSRAQTNLVILLATHPSTKSGQANTELGFRFPRTTQGNLRVPDVSYYLPGNEDVSDEDYPDRAPDLAAEVRSKGQPWSAVQQRLGFLAGQGTRCTLLIDPEARTVAVRDGVREWVAREGDEVVLSELNGFSFCVGDLFK